MKNRDRILKTVLAAMFLALSFILPFVTGQIAEIGSMLCPMHIPVLLCGFICGWQWGLAVGAAAPLLRSSVLGMPPFFSTAVSMVFELAVYGAVSGLMHKILPKKKPYIYFSLLSAMCVGRIAWGIAMYICMSINGNAFTVSAFLAGAVTNAIPGIIVQIALIPVIVMLIENPKIRKVSD